MILINTISGQGLENVNYTQAAFLTQVHRHTIGHWAKQFTVKTHKNWILYFKTYRLKKGMFHITTPEP